MLVDIVEAKKRFSEFVELFENGEKIVVTKKGKPVFQFARVNRDPDAPRELGFLGCDIDMSHFDEPIEDLDSFQ